jgi:hypothetical protein
LAVFVPSRKEKIGWDESFEQWPPPIDARRKMKRGGLMKNKREKNISLPRLAGRKGRRRRKKKM